MDHKEKLIEIHNSSFSIDDIKNIPEKYRDYVNIIGNKVCEQKGVYTVLITLLVHKSLFPAQDIRKHQEKMDGGFSGRTVDTKFITPTLKELGLPSMAESGWLTRSLEQPYPYTLDYLGNIRDIEVKQSFLNIIDYVENNPKKVEEILRLILYAVIQATSKQLIQVTKLTNPDYLTILSIIQALEEHFDTKYKVRGASKLPVLAVYAIYNSLIKDIKRYENKVLQPLSSHTASDLTSKTSGDIEIFDDKGHLFESLEIKHNKSIDITMIRNAYEKIIKYNPVRYYFLSTVSTSKLENQEIENLINKIRKEHGCQIIINGVFPTIQYYLRLISLERFMNDYSELINLDQELNLIHKEKWNQIIEKLNNNQ